MPRPLSLASVVRVLRPLSSVCEDVLAHAFAQCRSNKGTPGVDGQDFEAVEVYGVGKWLAKLALALALKEATAARERAPLQCAGRALGGVRRRFSRHGLIPSAFFSRGRALDAPCGFRRDWRRADVKAAAIAPHSAED